MQAEKSVTELTNELQSVEDELDAAESRLADTVLQLEEIEAQADENERYTQTLSTSLRTVILQIITNRYYQHPATDFYEPCLSQTVQTTVCKSMLATL